MVGFLKLCRPSAGLGIAMAFAACSEVAIDSSPSGNDEESALALETSQAELTTVGSQLRHIIDREVGGIDKLRVPRRDVDLPLPRQADGTVNPRFATTEAKRYL